MMPLGIATLTLSLLSIFIPLFGAYITILSAIFIAFSFGKGVLLGYVALLVNVTNILFLSPSIMGNVDFAQMNYKSATGISDAASVLIIIQIVSGTTLTLLHYFFKDKLEDK